MITSIIAAAAIFATLIIIHEAGHFIMAKRLGVRVLRFSIGYPPRIFGIRRGETDYAIGLTPLGGYVRMLGDEVGEDPSPETIKTYLKELQLDLIGAAKACGWLKGDAGTGDQALQKIASELVSPTSESVAAGRAISTLGRQPKADEMFLLREIERAGSVTRAIEILAETRPSALLERFRERAFPSQRLSKRVAIVLAGPLANILFAPLLMMVVFMVGVPMMLPVLGTVKQDMPGYAAGLRPGDQIISVNGAHTETWDDLSSAVKHSDGKQLDLLVRRPDSKGLVTFHLTVQPKLLPEQTVYGNKAPTWVIGVMPRGDEKTRRVAPLPAIRDGVVETAHMSVALFVGIAKIIDGTTPARQALGGPIMIAQMAGREAHQGFADVALFMVMLSLELGVINLLPVPLLDGGHLLFFIIEGIRGKPLQLRHREIAMQVGLFLLVILMVFVILNDISRIIG
jgi:regulator of sigma E protease